MAEMRQNEEKQYSRRGDYRRCFPADLFHAAPVLFMLTGRSVYREEESSNCDRSGVRSTVEIRHHRRNQRHDVIEMASVPNVKVYGVHAKVLLYFNSSLYRRTFVEYIPFPGKRQV
jgi:hypothetical protein